MKRAAERARHGRATAGQRRQSLQAGASHEPDRDQAGPQYRARVGGVPPPNDGNPLYGSWPKKHQRRKHRGIDRDHDCQHRKYEQQHQQAGALPARCWCSKKFMEM